MTTPTSNTSDELDQQLEKLKREAVSTFHNDHADGDLAIYKLLDDLKPLIQAHCNKRIEAVDRFEVIDETGRAYVKGSIYGSPVKIEQSIQDDGKTLKIFVTKLLHEEMK